MSFKTEIQAVIKVNGIDCFYLRNNEIEAAITNLFKARLLADGKKVDTIETTLNSPPLIYKEK